MGMHWKIKYIQILPNSLHQLLHVLQLNLLFLLRYPTDWLDTQLHIVAHVTALPVVCPCMSPALFSLKSCVGRYQRMGIRL